MIEWTIERWNEYNLCCHDLLYNTLGGDDCSGAFERIIDLKVV